MLLVDDDEVFGKILSKVAHNEQIPLTFISSVRDLQRFERVNFDVGIFDYDLGSITGLQLSGFLERYLQDIPIILVSAYRDIGSRAWPKSVKNFVSKSAGSYEILNKALKVYEESLRDKSARDPLGRRDTDAPR